MERHPIDALVAELAPVRDDELAGRAASPAATRLAAEIIALPADRRRRQPARRRLLALAAAVVLAAVFALPTLGVGERLVSVFDDWKDLAPPVPVASDVVIAEGRHGVRWRLLANESDRGLCFGLAFRDHDGNRFVGDGCRPVRLSSDGKRVLDPRSFGFVGSPDVTAAIAFGLVHASVASVELILDGREVEASIVRWPDGFPAKSNARFYWALEPCSPTPCGEDAGFDAVIARDASGREIERWIPPWNGNPTGDPDGARRP